MTAHAGRCNEQMKLAAVPSYFVTLNNGSRGGYHHLLTTTDTRDQVALSKA